MIFRTVGNRLLHVGDIHSYIKLASSRVDNDVHSGEPPVPSPVLSTGIQYYSLVAVIYYSTLNHFVTQFCCKERWFKYDCMQRSAITTSSTDFNSDWYLGFQHMFMYLSADVYDVAYSPAVQTRPTHRHMWLHCAISTPLSLTGAALQLIINGACCDHNELPAMQQHTRAQQ